MTRRSKRNRKPLPVGPIQAVVESLTHDARGVARVNGKAVFVEGTLPGEVVMFTYVDQHKRYDEGQLVEVLQPSAHRVEPRCVHFSACGGCSLQHMDPAEQIHAKQQMLLDSLTHIGKVTPESWLPPLIGPQWGYRHKGRLGAKYVLKKSTMLVGFREKRGPLLAELTRCEVLHPAVGERIMELRALLNGLHARQDIPQIEVAVGEGHNYAAALVFRNMVTLDEHDIARLCEFGEQYNFQIYLQPGGYESVTLLWPTRLASSTKLSYSLPEYNLELFFLPTDFTQVNAEMNRAMINRTLALLDPQPEDRVLDLFCGLGNFTLPLARRAGHVVGVEGAEQLVQRARENATHNGIKNIEFHAADLDLRGDLMMNYPWLRDGLSFAHGTGASLRGGFNKILLDPPRTGALDLIKRLPELGAPRIVYVSCNPATLARDAAELVHQHGYRMVSVGVMDMFPHTTHVESIALFEKY